MNIIARVLGFAAKYLGTLGDGDGRIEITDVPAAFAQLAAMKAQGEQLIKTVEDTLQAFRALASDGKLVGDAQTLTAADVQAAFDKAKVPFSTAASEARADMAGSL